MSMPLTNELNTKIEAFELERLKYPTYRYVGRETFKDLARENTLFYSISMYNDLFMNLKVVLVNKPFFMEVG